MIPAGKPNGSSTQAPAMDVLRNYTRFAMPTTMLEVFDWGEWMWNRCGEYARGINNIISYFLVDIEVTGIESYEEKKKFREYMLDEMKIMKHAYLVGKDLYSYGNCFITLTGQFERNLHCPMCKSMVPIKRIPVTLNADASLSGQCLHCKRKVTFKRVDIPLSEKPNKLIRWNPRDIDIEYNNITEDADYYLKPGSETKRSIMRGDRVYLEHTPWRVIEAVLQDKRIKFYPNTMLHLSFDGIASLKDANKGWGMPPFFASFDLVVMLNLLKNYNQAILIDFLIPFRFLSLASKGGPDSGDPLFNHDAGDFMAAVRGMVQQQRANPMQIHSIPFPVQYQAIGGEAKQLAPVELLKYHLETLFTTMGIPPEFWQTNLGKNQGPPMSLRIFERQHTPFVQVMDDFINWVGSSVAENEMWAHAKLRFKRTSIVEDESVKQVKLQMLASNKVSNDTALSPFGINYEEEIDKTLDEQELFDKRMAILQRRQQKAQELQGIVDTPLQPPGGMPGDPAMMQGGGGGMPPDGGGGAPMPGGGAGGGMPAPGSGSATMDDLTMQAEQMAQQILTMDPYTRRSTLLQLRKDNEALAALTKDKLRQLEQTASQQGLNMTRAGQLPPPGAPMQ